MQKTTSPVRLLQPFLGFESNLQIAQWSTNLRDTDQALQAFFDGCSDAGPERCAFSAPTPANVSLRFNNLLRSIQTHPVPVVTSSSHDIVDYSLVRSAVFNALYSPYKKFQLLAKGLADLEAGDGAAFLELPWISRPKFGCSTVTFYDNLMDASRSILCSEGEAVQDSLADLQAYYEQLSKSSSFADQWATIRTDCS
jgi:hypothetical protein